MVIIAGVRRGWIRRRGRLPEVKESKESKESKEAKMTREAEDRERAITTFAELTITII